MFLQTPNRQSRTMSIVNFRTSFYDQDYELIDTNTSEDGVIKYYGDVGDHRPPTVTAFLTSHNPFPFFRPELDLPGLMHPHNALVTFGFDDPMVDSPARRSLMTKLLRGAWENNMTHTMQILMRVHHFYQAETGNHPFSVWFLSQVGKWSAEGKWSKIPHPVSHQDTSYWLLRFHWVRKFFDSELY
jgi:hypothetical protein